MERVAEAVLEAFAKEVLVNSPNTRGAGLLQIGYPLPFPQRAIPILQSGGSQIPALEGPKLSKLGVSDFVLQTPEAAERLVGRVVERVCG